MYSLQIALFLEHLIKLMIVMRQELMEAFVLDGDKPYSKKTFKRSPE